MKVCLLNDSFPPVIDGVVNVMMNYADHLMQDYGTEVIVGTPRYPNADYTKYPYPVVAYPSLDTAAVTNGYRAGNPFTKECAALADFGPDIIHSHCPSSATIVARLMREKTGAPIVFTYHTKYDVDIRRYMKLKTLADESIRAMVGNIEACDEIWTVSRGAGESLKALGFSGEYRVMNNGVDFQKGRVDDALVAAATAGYDLPENVPILLFVGRMITYKGLPLILDALKRLSDAGQDFCMVFIGKGPDRELLEARAAELDLMDTATSPGKCIFVGPIYDRDVLRAWNTRADLFLFPSTFDTNGLVVREAAACGLACVLIRDSCAAEGITDGRNGFIIDETPEAMAALLQTVLKDRNRLRQMGQHAMDELYLSWKDCVGEAYERYQWVLEQKRSGLLPPRKKLLTDYLVKATVHTMEERMRYQKLKKALFDDFKESAIGMMDNFREAGESMEQLWDRIEREIASELSTRRKG